MIRKNEKKIQNVLLFCTDSDQLALNWKKKLVLADLISYLII